MNSFSDEDLAKHIRAETQVEPHKEADKNISLSRSHTLQTHNEFTQENVEEVVNNPLPLKITLDSTITNEILPPPVAVGEDHLITQEDRHELKLTNNVSSDRCYHTDKAPFLEIRQPRKTRHKQGTKKH